MIIKAKWLRYDYVINQGTYPLIASVEQQRGTLSRQTRVRCDEYAADVLGGMQYAPGIRLFALLNGAFREGWLPENYWGRYVAHYAQGAYGRVSYMKPMSQYVFRSALFPDIGSYVNGLWLNQKMEVMTKEAMIDWLFTGRDRIVFKSDADFLQGLGVYFFTRESFDPQKIIALGNGVFQEHIEQHPMFSEMMPDSVATIRITTVSDAQGKISARATFIRLGRSGQLNVKAKSEINVLADVETGVFDDDVYDSYYHRSAAHPDTGYKFGGKTLPCYRQCVDAVVGLHARIPQVRSIGWDLIVDKNEQVKIMEWNGADNGVRIVQGILGPIFADLGWNKLHLLKTNPGIGF